MQSSLEAERDALSASIGRLVDRAPDARAFEELAVRAASYQYRRIEAFRRLCAARGVDPRTLDPADWHRVPAVPVAAFKSLALHTDPPREIFRSSGTLGGLARRSVHHHPFPELYHRVIDATFADACLPPGSPRRRPLLALVPSRQQAPDSSLAFMVARILDRHGLATVSDAASDSDPGPTASAFGEGGVVADRVDAWCAARVAEGSAGTILATAFALVQWMETSERRFVLPAGTTIFETGGFKGRVREVTRARLLEKIHERLGVPADRVVREYGMTELTGHVYTEVLRGGDADLFRAPPFLRLRVLDPPSLEPAPAGEPGLVAFFDLANLGSAVHVVSQDLGRLEGGGLRLLGRASGSELRGCSLTVEELSGEPAPPRPGREPVL